MNLASTRGKAFGVVLSPGTFRKFYHRPFSVQLPVFIGNVMEAFNASSLPGRVMRTRIAMPSIFIPADVYKLGPLQSLPSQVLIRFVGNLCTNIPGWSEIIERDPLFRAHETTIGDRVQAIQSNPLRSGGEMEWKLTGGGGRKSRKDWHLGTLARTYRNSRFMGSPPSHCPTLRRPSGPKRSNLKTYLTPHSRPFYKILSPGLQRVKGCSANFNWELDGFGDTPDPFDFLPFNGYSNNFGSMNRGAFQPGQGSGSDLQTGLEISNDSLQFLLGTAESTLSIPTLQPQYHNGINLPVQQPLYAPLPPVPLSINTQSNTRGPRWDATEPAPNILDSRSQYHHNGGDSTIRPSSHAPPTPSASSANPQFDVSRRARDAGFVAGWFASRGGSLSQPQQSGPEWNAGFVAGCMLASRMLVGPPSSASPPQPSPTTTSMQIAPSMRATTVPNDVGQSLSTAAGPDVQAAVNQQPHDQPGPSTFQITTRSNTPNDAQPSVPSTSQEPASGVNNDISTGSNIGPIRRRRDRKKHTCSDCGKEFSGKYRLDNHIKRDHLGQAETYTCHFPGCEKPYANQAGVRRHYNAKHRAQEASNLDEY
ncbi:unnamed protein product [Rhizoctonia solani]|uniref:C2H2-type domain-containing protein n=1 Tax=Rhizoctonia solani TaxID=456999 RepID=A0A8H3D3C9_9AGAM|nr:unnamed protein product [Rhizoctonia solani]